MKSFKAILFLTYVALVFANVNANKFKNINHPWDVYIKGKTYDRRDPIFCRILIIKPQVFLTSASCINKALSEYPDQSLSTYSSLLDDIPINKNDIYYNEDFSQTYNSSKRDVAMIVINKSFNTKNVMFTLANNIDDIDYSSCCNPIEGTLFPCTDSSFTQLSCSDDSISAYPGDPIICTSKEYPYTVLLAGLKASHYINDQNELVIINSNLGDLKHIIDRKLQIHYFK